MHDLFLQNDRVKSLFLENDLVKLLCDLFLPELQRKRAGKGDGKDKGSLSSKAEQWKMEEDLLGFIKAICLYGCMASSGITLIDEAILVGLVKRTPTYAKKTLDLLTNLPGGYVRALQRRILHDVLLFFHENYFLGNSTLVSTFKQLCILVCNHVCYEDFEAQDKR